MNGEWQLLGQAASQALAAGQFREASSLFRQVVEIVPDHADSWYNLGYSLRRHRDYPGAVEAYSRALA